MSVSQAQVTAAQTGAVTVTAGSGGTPATPGFYHFSVPATDNTGAATTQSGWIVVGKPAATLVKTSGDGQTGSVGTTLPLPLTVTLTPGQSGGTAGGASVFFTTSAGSLSNGTVSGPKVVAATDASA